MPFFVHDGILHYFLAMNLAGEIEWQLHDGFRLSLVLKNHRHLLLFSKGGELQKQQ